MIVVVGAGAAGLIAAIFARDSGQRVLLLEKTKDGGRKILISGGGRCNILPQALEPERFVTSSPRNALRRVLRSWPLREQMEFFEKQVGVPLKLETAARKYFPVSNRARDVRDGLVSLARAKDVELQFETDLRSLRPSGGTWVLGTSAGEIQASRVILATGGLSVPATGSDGTGLSLAVQLGHDVHATYPALTPLVAETRRHAALSGVSVNARIRARADGQTAEATGGFLFTHRGYSGPVVLDVSHVAVKSLMSKSEPARLRVQWCELTEAKWDAALRTTDGLVLNALSKELPQRLAEALMDESRVPSNRRLAELRRSERVALVERLTTYELPWTGDEGYAKAEVTGGGVALTEVDLATLESRRHAGLFMCGEMLDAFGPIGGHNFVWAWATGRLAGLGAAAAS